nr:MAG TPA: hypothetical protein [Caudoviricetes sp.]
MKSNIGKLTAFVLNFILFYEIIITYIKNKCNIAAIII